jgi:hypothetical protein
MGLFDFVENFFFIGLALLFVLVLLLVYHFKQRMNSVEKKGDNMYDLLTNVVKELRNIRTTMVAGTVPVVETAPSAVVLPTIVEEEKIDDSDSEDIESEESVYSEDSDEQEEDGITYQIIDTYRNSSVAEKRVVVSDEETDTDTDTESGSDIESESESDSEDDQEEKHVPVETYTEDIPLETVDVAVEETNEVVYIENPMRGSFNNLNTIALSEGTSTEVVEEIPLETEETQHIPLDGLAQNNTDDIQPISRENVDKSSVYKKMSVSQLRALAIQNGIQGDTSKLKKNALVDFLVEKQA